MPRFFISIVQIFFTAFGVVLGGSIFAGISAIITDTPPVRTMVIMATSVKIWAMAIALGGTFSSFSILDKSLFEGEMKIFTKQILHIFIALLGANAGCSFIKLILRCSELWGK